ncbi:MAG: hypothetical protein HOF21_06460 [Nitrospina sp.]|jgi:hypothetical protein|nr:hypothetical protein [Nitrospina sp.]MBT5633369.1 hypothetical protein [Nitrospina sp.]
MRLTFLSIYSGLLLLTFISPVLAFDDDSRDDSSSQSLNTFCENNQTLNDTSSIKSSCQGDIVNLQSQNDTLLKNGKEISRHPVRDFKVSRNGKVYYRTQNGPFLADESGRLESLGGAVIIYLVSKQGDIVYLNDQGIVFKNGTALNQNRGRVIFQKREAPFTGQRIFIAPNLAVTKNGRAIYINDMGLLFVDQIAMSPHTAKVLKFKVDSQGTVFYLDDLGRLFKNRTKMSRKPVKVKEFKLNAQSQIAYLTDGSARNLYFEDQNLSAGSHRILSFSFTGTGEVIYNDDKGRVWKMGQLISK